jgi:putative Mg2+ transporter-C (MgtC) family protein
MGIDLVFALRLLIATGLGGLIGLQRELSGKPAGLRTNMLICLGAALITHVSIMLPTRFGVGDPARIAAQIVAGIGFLGAGTIMRSRHAVHGLTSAATIWVVAAVGLAVGAGYERQAAFATVVIMIALAGLGRAEARLLGQSTMTASLIVDDAAAGPDELLRRLGVRRLLSRKWTQIGSGRARFYVVWRGTEGEATRLASAAAAIPGLSVESWEVEE